MFLDGETSRLIYFDSRIIEPNSTFIRNDLINAVSKEENNLKKGRICPVSSIIFIGERRFYFRVIVRLKSNSIFQLKVEISLIKFDFFDCKLTFCD